jgi:hypothetical protein
MAVLGVAAFVTLTGCQPAPKPVAPPPPPPATPTAEDVTQTQHDFAAVDPHAKVGRVSAVSVGDHMAVVSGIALTDVKKGDPISFTGPDHEPFANGSIFDLDNHTSTEHPFLIVDYQKASTNGRDPAVGDIAIYIPMGG